LIPLVVMTSQGLASGDVNRDAQPLRFMIHEGVPVVLVQSFDTVSTVSFSWSAANPADDGNIHRKSFDRFGGCQEPGRESQSQLSITGNSEGNVPPSITLGGSCRSCYSVESEIVHSLVSFVMPSELSANPQVERDQSYGRSFAECPG
jgi:hypothetical protein